MPTTAILGGGLSGLCSAYFLARSLPATHKIVLLEKSKRFGGWIQTVRKGQDGIDFETGPRSIRPVGLAGLLTLQVVSRSVFCQNDFGRKLTASCRSTISASQSRS